MEYTLKFNYTALKLLRRGSIKGIRSGNGECVFSTNFEIDELKMDDLESIAYSSLLRNPEANKIGSIQSIN